MFSLCIPKRYEMVLMLAYGAMVAYTMRVNMSVASLAMKEDLNWTESQRGLALSGFYWGYAAGQLLAAPLVQYVGAKVSFGAAVLLTSITTLFIPIAWQQSFELGLFIRILTGLVESFIFPAIYHFIPAWIPMEEKTLLVPVIYAGSYVGNIITFSVSGSIIEQSYEINGQQYGKWYWIFYIFAIMGFAFFPYWMIMAYERPEDHPSISDEELKIIRSGKHYVPSTQDKTTNESEEESNNQSTTGNVVTANSIGNLDTQNNKETSGNEKDEGEGEMTSEVESSSGNDSPVPEYSYPIGALHLAHNMMAVASSSRIGRLHSDSFHVGSKDNEDMSVSSSKISGRPRKVSIVDKNHYLHEDMARHTPWKAFFTHPVSLTLLLNSWVMGWITFTLMSEMPHYLNSIGFNVSSSGMLCVYPYIALFITSLLFGAVFEYMHLHFHVTTTNIRRLAETVAYIGAGVGLIICGFMVEKNTSYAFLIVTQSLFGAVQSGIQCAYSDVAPNYSSAMNTLGNFLSAMAGIAGPLIVTDLLASLGDTWGWRVVFLLTAAQGVIAIVFWFMYQTADIVPELNNPTSESHKVKLQELIPVKNRSDSTKRKMTISQDNQV